MVGGESWRSTLAEEIRHDASEKRVIRRRVVY